MKHHSLSIKIKLPQSKLKLDKTDFIPSCTPYSYIWPGTVRYSEKLIISDSLTINKFCTMWLYTSARKNTIVSLYRSDKLEAYLYDFLQPALKADLNRSEEYPKALNSIYNSFPTPTSTKQPEVISWITAIELNTLSMSKCCLYGNLDYKVYKINHIYVVWWLFKEAPWNYSEVWNEGSRLRGDGWENIEQANWPEVQRRQIYHTDFNSAYSVKLLYT